MRVSNLDADITVSIIVPIYKVEDEINRCLLSILRQDYRQIELILVNDCTPDNSFLLAKQLVDSSLHQLSSIIYLEHDRNKGVSSARNTGINHSNGEYVFFLDSDDELHSTQSISLLVNIVKRDNFPDVVVGSFQKIDFSGDKKEFISREISCFTVGSVQEQYLEGGFWMTVWGKMISKKLLVDNNIFFEEGLLHEDNLWSFFLYRSVNTLSVIPDKVYNYYDREGSIMHTMSKKNARDLLFIVHEMWNDYCRRNDFCEKETVSIININRDVAMKAMIILGDKNFIDQGISSLKKIKLPLFKGDMKVIKRNMLFLLPKKIIFLFFKKKYMNKKVFE